jgi:hypothetical protein
MAGQLILTKAPFLQGDREWSRFASTSFAVPLCSPSEIAILELAAISNFWRMLPLAREVPKITFLGGSFVIGPMIPEVAVSVHFIVFAL